MLFRSAEIAYGTTIGMIHFTDAAGFLPILKIIIERIGRLNLGSKDTAIGACGHLLFIAVSVRKGSRIAAWAAALDALVCLLELYDISSHDTVIGVYNAAAVILSSSPLDVMIPRFRAAMNAITLKRQSQHFLAFCNDLCSLNPDRFHELVYPYFQK